MAHPNEAILQRGYEAFAKGDLETVMSVFDEDIVWHSGGRNPFSGDYRGHREVGELFGRIFELSGGTFKNEVQDILANDHRAVVVLRITAQRGTKSLDDLACHVWNMRDGKATEFWIMGFDPYTSDEFWD